MVYDAIVVLGGGVRAGGELPTHAQRRLDLALARELGEPIVILSAGTAHRPATLDRDGRLIYESTAGARYLIERGIAPERIFCETTSYDTIGNAYFARVQILDPMGWRRLLVITSEFHMARSEAVFQWIFGLDCPKSYELEFAASPDDGLSAAAMSARRAHEVTALQHVLTLQPRLTSLRAVATWLFTGHGQYQAIRESALVDDGELLESY